MALIVKLADKPAISNLMQIMISDEEDINTIDVGNVAPGSIAYTENNEKKWRLGQDFTWHEMATTSGEGSGSSSSAYGAAVYS